MKKLGLTQRVDVVSSYGERRDCLDQEWAKLVSFLGFIPVPLCNLITNVDSYIKGLGISGVILTGGNDLAVIPRGVNVAPERDFFENNLIETCSNLEIPMLGVCRGMQVLANFYGAELSQVDGHVASRHDILLDRNIFPDWPEKVEVNSFHNYGIHRDKLGCELKSLAQSEGGYVEMIKHSTFPQYGMMWHPERERPFQKVDISFFNDIFDLEKGDQ